MENKAYYIINHEEYLEILLRATLSEKDLFREINLILSIGKYNETVSFPQLISIRLDEDNYKLEIQIILKESEKKKVIGVIEGINYNLIT